MGLVPVTSSLVDWLIIFGAILGLGISLGGAQWLVIRRRLATGRLWVIGSGAGVIAGFTTTVVLSATLTRVALLFMPEPCGICLGHIIAMAMGGIVGGALAGLIQWLALRHYYRVAGWWIPASTISLMVGIVVSFVSLVIFVAIRWMAAMPSDFDINSFIDARKILLPGIFSGLSGGAVIGIITGIALMIILRRPISPEVQATKPL